MNENHMILILEDDQERITRFIAALSAIDPTLKTKIWTNARTMIRELDPFLPSATLLSLDHDLYAPPPEDPGDGLELAQFLAPKRLSLPIIIHSSNADRSTRMAGKFQLEHWPTRLVLPFGENWIEKHWTRTVQEMLKIKSND